MSRGLEEGTVWRAAAAGGSGYHAGTASSGLGTWQRILRNLSYSILRLGKYEVQHLQVREPKVQHICRLVNLSYNILRLGTQRDPQVREYVVKHLKMFV